MNVLFYLIISQLQVSQVTSNFCYKLLFGAYLITYAPPPKFPVVWAYLLRNEISMSKIVNGH